MPPTRVRNCKQGRLEILSTGWKACKAKGKKTRGATGATSAMKMKKRQMAMKAFKKGRGKARRVGKH